MRKMTNLSKLLMLMLILMVLVCNRPALGSISRGNKGWICPYGAFADLKDEAMLRELHERVAEIQ